MRRALEECRNYADTFTPSSRSMFFQGKTGLGKTHMSLSIAKEVIRKGYNVLYTCLLYTSVLPGCARPMGIRIPMCL